MPSSSRPSAHAVSPTCASARQLSGSASSVRVNAVVLGVVDTPMARNSWMARCTPEQFDARRARYPLGFGTPEKVADVIDFFLGEASAWITGQCLVADGGHQLT